ncbi:hypothetical protein FNV43_RR08781 [Rhamnella rubrinervis]|uniref:Leucine-rich repeat-containing N-terminal plant-type domain-containing protein n=1 Tax=Rhamnella rubrinervis TaxID=2594499 RepID=A0A8K0MJK7_9ROSA|nr:hypothetical protein FNV43_RR08781 [Rhamnella rubrinervis]
MSIYSSLFNHVNVVSAQCLAHQQSLLLQLKDTLIFDANHSTILVKWNQSSDCCSWAGISREEGRVTGLDLSHEPITGQIPIEISRLKKLRILDLSETSDLRISNLRMLVQNLTELEELYLDSVNISAPGNEWGQALSSSLPKLRVLSLAHCGLGGPIHQSLAKLQHLSVIKLSFNKLSSPVPRLFGNFSNLTSLRLRGCNLHGTFPKEMFQAPTLRILSISDNGLLEGSLPEFPPNSDLQFLGIRFTNFSGPLPKSIATLTQLVHLDLSHNQFVGPISSAHLEGLLNLVSFNLSNNAFNGNIPSSLFTLPLLEMIDLSNNQFSGQILEFSNAHSSMLEGIDLSSNKLEGSIPMSIFQLRQLYHLGLSYNMFNGTTQLDMIKDLTKLRILDLSHNNMSVNVGGKGSNISFPQLFDLRLASCNLRKFPNLSHQLELNFLDLSANQIYGDIPNWIWNVGPFVLLNLSHNHLMSIEEPYNISHLSGLDLSFNQLHGKIPILPPDVYYVDLSSNSFTSSIPSELVKNHRNTFYLSLSNNSLTGIIPDSICEVINMQVLDLSNNNLTGIIPTCMLAMSGNIEVNLHNNNLSGPIPDLFPVGCGLRTLNLSGNLLTKSIPKSLANCRQLEDIDLGNNQMLDTFPIFLKNISSLRVLILRSNKFYGQITCTESIGDWPMIQIVDIASNNFSGELPGKCLTKWHTMITVGGIKHSPALPGLIGTEHHYEVGAAIINKGLEMKMPKIVPNRFTYIDFSSNKFHGEIPKELGQFISLYGLNLSNNVLRGQIPSSFGNMRQIESLDLSRNHLNGTIPASLSNLNFLGFLNLSYNQLHGRIPTGNQIQTFSADRFQGNQGLCGLPVTLNCPGDAAAPDISPETPKANHSISGNNEIEWNLISAEIGFIVGFGTVIGPLMFRKRWRKWYFDRVEDIAFSILPQILLRKWLSWKMGTRRRVRSRRAS